MSRHTRLLEQLKGRPLPKELRWHDVSAALQSFGIRCQERPHGNKALVYIPGQAPIAIARDGHGMIGIGAIKHLALALFPATRPPFVAPPTLPTPPGVEKQPTLTEMLDALPSAKVAEPAPEPEPEPEEETPVTEPVKPEPVKEPEVVHFEATTSSGKVTCVIDAPDWTKLKSLIDTGRIHATQTSVYVPAAAIIDPALRAHAVERRLQSVQLAHLILGLEPGSTRVFRKDRNAFNLRRTNLPKPIVTPAQAPAAPRRATAMSTFAIEPEVTTVYVLRINGEEAGRYPTEGAAREALAERLLDEQS